MIRLSTCLFLVACTSSAPASSEHEETAEVPNQAPAEAEAAEAEAAEAEAAEAEAAVVETPPGTFGAELTDRALTSLDEIAGSPETFAGTTVKTEGEITAVCQRMGCWMEMRAEGTPAVRVPMAGHSFFLPRDVSGRHATVEGEVSVRPLSAAERQHLASEGAQATDQALQIAAVGVAIR